MTTRGLVWFVHFHKAGGTSLVELARRRGLVFAERHENGNPLSADGKSVRLWDLSAEGLSRWVDQAVGRGVEFVATEWGVPRLDVLAARGDVQVVTAVREPVQRLLSNFVFDVRQGWTPARSLDDYLDHPLESHTWSNYYTRMLAGRDWVEDPDAGDEMLRLAVSRLGLIDEVAVLEKPGSMNAVALRLGWDAQPVHTNRSDASWTTRQRRRVKVVRRGRLDLWRHVDGARPVLDPGEFAALRERNALDLALYGHALAGGLGSEQSA